MRKTEKWLLEKMPRIGCALYAFKHAGNKDYFRKAVQTDSLILRCESRGKDNPDKNIYYIELGERNNGFFAVYHKLLKHLYYADRFGFIPVVRFTKDYLYSESHEVNGTDNPFEYYYLQPGGVSVGEALKSRNVFKAEYIHTRIEDLTSKQSGDYEVSEEYIELLGRVAGKYIHLNKKTKDEIEQDISNIKTDGRTIGVHYRGADYKREFSRHPVFTGIDEYVEIASDLLDTGEYDRIFLATDDEGAVRGFESRFPGKVITYDDVCRTDSDVSVAFSNSDRPDHHYRLGFEVLRDMLTLSRCNALVAGASQVSLAARITKSSYGEKYKDEKIIFHGVNKRGTDDHEYYKSYGVGK